MLEKNCYARSATHLRTQSIALSMFGASVARVQAALRSGSISMVGEDRIVELQKRPKHCTSLGCGSETEI